ncbi:MAG: hypothetical protein WDA27_07450 [Actinomycetota bacterium]
MRRPIAALACATLISMVACGSKVPRAAPLVAPSESRPSESVTASTTTSATETPRPAPSPSASPSSIPTRRHVPDEVLLGLRTPRNGSTRKLQLRFSAFGLPSTCGSVGPLEVSKRLKEDLQATIQGFDRTEGKRGSVCGGAIQVTSSTIDIPLSWARAKARTIVVDLSGKKNTFQLTLEGYVAVLDPSRTPNVFSGRRDLPDRRVGSSQVTAILYPQDVGRLYVAASGDYVERLRTFAGEQGWLDARETYGFPDANPEKPTMLWVVVRNRELPPPHRGEMVGKIGSAEVHLACEE